MKSNYFRATHFLALRCPLSADGHGDKCSNRPESLNTAWDPLEGDVSYSPPRSYRINTPQAQLNSFRTQLRLLRGRRSRARREPPLPAEIHLAGGMRLVEVHGGRCGRRAAARGLSPAPSARQLLPTAGPPPPPPALKARPAGRGAAPRLAAGVGFQSRPSPGARPAGRGGRRGPPAAPPASPRGSAPAPPAIPHRPAQPRVLLRESGARGAGPARAASPARPPGGEPLSPQPPGGAAAPVGPDAVLLPPPGSLTCRSPVSCLAEAAGGRTGRAGREEQRRAPAAPTGFVGSSRPLRCSRSRRWTRAAPRLPLAAAARGEGPPRPHWYGALGGGAGGVRAPRAGTEPRAGGQAGAPWQPSRAKNGLSFPSLPSHVTLFLFHVLHPLLGKSKLATII